MILKIYNKEEIKNYKREIAVFNSIQCLRNNVYRDYQLSNIVSDLDLSGFPRIISAIEEKECAEILMKNLG